MVEKEVHAIVAMETSCIYPNLHTGASAGIRPEQQDLKVASERLKGEFTEGSNCGKVQLDSQLCA